MIFELLIIILSLLGFGYWKFSRYKNYWHERGVPNTGFKFIKGDEWELLSQTESVHETALRHYKQFAGVPFYGGWTFLGFPYLMIRNDFDLIRAIWIKDFDHFAIANGNVVFQKSIWPATREEKLMTGHVQMTHGDEWKDIRYFYTNYRLYQSFSINI